jgi:bifunctional non-homologous end joining protein LigD
MTVKSAGSATKLVLHGINITHPDRVISQTSHLTKGALAEYYAAVAPFMLPQIVRHPVSLLRCPAGIDNQCFYQRKPGKGLGPDVHPFDFEYKGNRYQYIYIDDEKGLMELVQMGAVELHPWGASINAIDYPDRIIFDLDPAPGVPMDAVKHAARELRDRLKRAGLESYLKCTGGKGLHVTASLAAKDKWEDVKAFASAIAHEMVDAEPDAYIATMSKAKRDRKIFIDYLRNDYTATAIADYSVRARPGAPVAVPLDWKELDSLESASQFSMSDVLRRMARKKPRRQSEPDQRLPAKGREKVQTNG